VLGWSTGLCAKRNLAEIGVDAVRGFRERNTEVPSLVVGAGELGVKYARCSRAPATSPMTAPPVVLPGKVPRERASAQPKSTAAPASTVAARGSRFKSPPFQARRPSRTVMDLSGSCPARGVDFVPARLARKSRPARLRRAPRRTVRSLGGGSGTKSQNSGTD